MSSKTTTMPDKPIPTNQDTLDRLNSINATLELIERSAESLADSAKSIRDILKNIAEILSEK